MTIKEIFNGVDNALYNLKQGYWSVDDTIKKLLEIKTSAKNTQDINLTIPSLKELSLMDSMNYESSSGSSW